MGLFGSSAPPQPPPPHVQADTLFSDDLLEMIIAVSEGPIKGPVNGLKSIYLSDTALVDASNKPNVGPFELSFWKGESSPTAIKPKLGGLGSSTSVGVQLETNLPVVRTGQHANIDFLEVRMVISRLVQIDPTYGEFIWHATWRVEVKPHSSTNWNSVGLIPPNPATNPTPVVTQGTDTATYSAMHLWGDANVLAKREMYTQGTAPTTASSVNAVWFNTTANYTPKLWSGTAWVTPTALQYVTPSGNYPYYSWTEAGVARKAYIGWMGTSPAGMTQYDYWVVPPNSNGNSDVTSHVWNGSAWVASTSWSLPATASPGDFTISGKTTSPYVKEIRIPVARINEPYDVRVTKLTQPDNMKYFCDMSWESFQEVTAQTLSFPNLALMQGVFRSSDQFSSMPEFTAEMEGRIIKVPTNYDPVAKTYTGIWDGTYKLAYSNNIGWIVNDLVTNTTYGVSAYQNTVLDKYAVYAFAQHCDTHGFTYNDVLQDPRPIEDAVNYLCGIAGGRYVELGNGFATILFDADDQQPVALFSPENTADGVFNYSFTDVTTRKNDIVVSYINPALNWREDQRRVSDTGAIAQYGRIPEEFIAVGCIDETEAVKRARLRLVTAQTEKALVSFKTNRQGAYISPFDVILVADEDSGFGISGRIKAVTGAKTITLRDPVYFEAALTYVLDITTTTGAPFTTQLVTSAGTTSTLTTVLTLPSNIAAQATFSISCANTVGVPKAYRVTAIEEVDGDPDNISISAIEVNRTKWAFVDGAYTPVSLNETGLAVEVIQPVSNVQITPRVVLVGQQDLQLTWDPTPTVPFSVYRIYQSVNGGAQELVGEVRDTTITSSKVVLGTYRFTVYTVGINGQLSLPVTVEHTVSGAIREVVAISNLRLIDGASQFEFDTQSPEFAWDPSADPYFDHYLVKITDVSTGSVKRTVITQALRYIYDYATNTTDFGGTASRSFKLEVIAVDSTGSSSAAASITVSNPRPSPPSTVNLSSQVYSLYVSFTRPSLVRDWAGAKVYASTTQGFTPSDTTLVYDGPNNNCTVPIQLGQVKYVRVGFYDTFDKTITAYSSEFSLTGTGLDPHTISYDMLTTDLQTTINSSDGVQQLTTRVEDIEGQFYGSWVVKIQTQNNVGGGTYPVISGFGLSQSGGNGTVSSDFIVQADRFSVMPAYNAASPVAKYPVFQIGTKGGVAAVGIKGDMYLDGSITAQALSVNSLSAISANIGTVTAGLAQSTDGKFVIDLTNRTITISD